MIGRLDCKITRNGNQTPFFRGTRVDSHFSNAPFFLAVSPVRGSSVGRLSICPKGLQEATSGYGDADDEHGEHSTRIVYVKDQMGHSSIQVTVDIYGHLIPGANVCSLTDSMEAFRKRQEQVRHNPQPPRNRAKWRFRQIFCKLLKDLVAAVGLEPTTYGL
jgi:hypothetical protein